MGTVAILAQGSSLDLDVTAKMTVRALYFFVVGFSGLFAMQGCGGGDTTAAAGVTTASPQATASSSAGTRRAEPGVRVGLAKLHERACAHMLPILSKRLSARDESGSSASFL